MASNIKKTFDDNGSIEEFTATSFTVLAGSDNGSDFGGGSLAIEVSHDGVNFTTAETITEETASTSNEYTGGVVVKLTLSGATSPDLDVSVKYK